MLLKPLKNLVYEDEDCYIFFGNKQFSSEESTLGQNALFFGHQTHDAFIKCALELKGFSSSSFVSSSDGLKTSIPNQKLAIVTADCIPCFIYNDNNLYSLHLGWRGIHKGLFDKALSECSGKISVVIGPHIQEDSFEVGADVINAFKEVLPAEEDSWYTPKNDSKYHVSLKDILLLKSKKLDIDFYASNIDTFTNSEFNSYRRDHKTPDRNISFAFLKNKVK
ncbi:MAG: polyphenol oxidase family protein [Bdellovibrionales bacterium]